LKFRSRISTYAALRIFFVISSGFLTIPQRSQTVLGASVSDFPEFPQPGSPILTDIPLQEALNAFNTAQKAFATIQSAQLPMRFSEFYWLIAIAVIALAMIVVFVFLRKSRRRALAKVLVQPQVPTYPKKYCTNCGAALPLDVEFCLKCGARQE